jgi:3-oxoacyl-[acyl-carrier protein] reductase
MANAFDLSGKVALVTGSSRGIGAAIVRTLAAAGVRCAVNYVNDDSGRNLADAKILASEIGAPFLECDVADYTAAKRMIELVMAQLGRLDILVNNAGILRSRTLKNMTPQEWDSVIQVNLTGAFNCIAHVAERLSEGGRIVSISSVNALMGFFGTASYAASKAGLIALTKTAARELAARRITANAVAPGFIDTEMTAPLPQEHKQAILKQIPLGRWGNVQDIANAVLFLCSPAADYITGHVLHVNGGFLME